MNISIMKTIILLIGLTASLTAFSPIHETNISPEHTKRLASKVMNALQQESSETYRGLFPSSNDFNEIINENQALYGPYLHDAQMDFSNQYDHEIIAKLGAAFAHVIEEDKKKGIAWNGARLEKVEVIDHENNDGNGILIKFSQGGHAYQIRLAKVIQVNGTWKVTQFIELL